MKTIILPGFSPHNKEWAYDVKNKSGFKGKVLVHEWLHWKNGLSSLSLKKEIETISKEIGDESVNFISKSVGTRVTVNLLPLFRKNIKKIIFCGIPLRGFGDKTRKLFKEELGSFPSQKLIVFQNEKDPFGRYEIVKKFVEGINKKIKVVKKKRSDHNYPYFEDFGKFLG